MPVTSNLFSSVKFAKDATKGSYRLLKRIGTYFCCSITIIVILIVLMAIPITMISLGIMYLKSCPMQKMIPLWLIVFGALAIIKNLSTLIQRIKAFRRRSDSHQSSSTFLDVFDSFMALFMIIWFVCGNIWVYQNYYKVQYVDKDIHATYCNQLVYLFSFWIITSIYIFLVLACFIFCCTICFTIFLPTKE